VAALAEALHGCGKGFDLVFYMTIGSGIGGGLVVNGQVYHGAAPGEVEIGHVRLSKDGTTLESECSGWAVNKKVRDYITNHPESLLAQLAGNNAPEATLLLPALQKNDAAAQHIISSIADDLAFALAHVVHLFHPQTIIIGGGLSLLGEWLRLPVAERLPQYVMHAFLPPPLVQLTALQENVVPAGALHLAKTTYNSIAKT
jgi:glucokinase